MKYVVIESCRSENGWYKDKIGRMYKVIGENDLKSPYYTIVKNGRLLVKTDCREITSLETLSISLRKEVRK